jgi:CRP/FNR family transcriptional regulator, cyclic AMP receptor protein
MVDAALLADVPLFKLLDEQERTDLASRVRECSFAADQILFHAGDPGGSMYVIRTGTVEIFFKDPSGQRIVLETSQAGDFFGELSLMDGGSRTASAQAISAVQAIEIERADLDELFRLYPQAALDILAVMGKRMRASTEMLRRTAARNVVKEIEDKRTVIERAADWIAAFSGSIPFLAIHVAIFAGWIVWNEVPDWLHSFDPYPYGFLTMVVSLEAIILSVFVLLSQNRQVEKDRVRSDVEYEVNLKAELEIMQLHEKVDRLTSDVLLRLANLEKALKKVS